VITTFVVSFTVPYLLNAPYADLGPKVGFIHDSLTVLSVFVTFFMIPEMKVRSLEEVDELFASGVSLRAFYRVERTNVAAIDWESKYQTSQRIGYTEDDLDKK
jgi:MFS transporter, SP family, sugar:H+ symporter